WEVLFQRLDTLGQVEQLGPTPSLVEDAQGGANLVPRTFRREVPLQRLDRLGRCLLQASDGLPDEVLAGLPGGGLGLGLAQIAAERGGPDADFLGGRLVRGLDQKRQQSLLLLGCQLGSRARHKPLISEQFRSRITTLASLIVDIYNYN